MCRKITAIAIAATILMLVVSPAGAITTNTSGNFASGEKRKTARKV